VVSRALEDRVNITPTHKVALMAPKFKQIPYF
jgi:hypothetical protein